MIASTSSIRIPGVLQNGSSPGVRKRSRSRRNGISRSIRESRVWPQRVLGLGIYRGLRIGLDRLLQDGSLKLVLEDWNTPAPPVYVAYASHRNLPAKIRAFVDFMLECYPPATGHGCSLARSW